MLVFSMIVPFQMVMYTMTYVTNRANLDNLFGITFVYLGFGAGLSVFMLCGFIKSIPLEIEEAADDRRRISHSSFFHRCFSYA